MTAKINLTSTPSCRLSSVAPSIKRLQSLIYQASEQRQIEKSTRLSIDWSSGLEGAEQGLYQQLFRAAGYLHYQSNFLELSKRHRYGACFGPQRQTENPLSTWLGELGLLQRPTNHPELEALREEHTQAFCGEILDPISAKGRPSNDPVRRLTGLFHHFEWTKTRGLVKSWLGFFYQVEELLSQNKRVVPAVLALLDEYFPSPETDRLTHFNSFAAKQPSPSPQRLIGAERQRVLLVNTVMPFFLSWAVFSGDRRLERTLFGLFLLLPNEGKNYKTEAMSLRLGLGKAPLKLRSNLACHQGLIQFYDHLCGDFFDKDCVGCPLPGWLKAD